MEPKQYTLSDIKTLRERQQTAHRGRSIYSNMRSISEDAFRNALENGNRSRGDIPVISMACRFVESNF